MRATSFNWLTFNQPRQDRTSASVGGVVEIFTAAASLNTGDCVFLSAANTVNKSTTAANYAGFIGVVVGGQLTNNNITSNVGVAAAGANQSVMVQISGIANVVAGGTVTPGTNFSVVPDAATAGRVIAGTTAGQVLGTTVSAGTAAGTMKIVLNHR